MLKGYDVNLYRRTETGKDPFGNPVFDVEIVTVKDVLIAPVSSDDITGSHEADRMIFQLGIPKTDNNRWEDATVSFTIKGETYTGKVLGKPLVGIEELVPTKWHKKVTVEIYG